MNPDCPKCRKLMDGGMICACPNCHGHSKIKAFREWLRFRIFVI